MVIIKRYPNRKLYNTQAKQYINLADIEDLIRQGEEVQVIDHASGEDLTTLTLTQIILEQQKNQNSQLSRSLLTSLIRAGEDRLNALQRGLQSSLNFWRQIDEEIKLRVQELVRQGELTAAEGEKLADKFVKQGMRLREEIRARDESSQFIPQDLEIFLHKLQIPTQDDLHRLYEQLEELSAKLEEVSEAAAQDDN
jgi:polyhydroxyalkanoate synthesis repressor PhaR